MPVARAAHRKLARLHDGRLGVVLVDLDAFDNSVLDGRIDRYPMLARE
jgi:hypothetical protein